MTLDLAFALGLFAFATSITPGPNNLMLMASGANFGFRRTVPHMLGIGVGFTVMVVLVGLGLAGVMAAHPEVEIALKAGSLAFVIWLAWKTATASGLSGSDGRAQPLKFWQAAAFQWINPKAWAMALTALSVYAPDRSHAAVLAVALIFGAINLPAVSTWTLIGQAMARWLTNARRRQVFNIVMALLLLASMWPVLRS